MDKRFDLDPKDYLYPDWPPQTHFPLDFGNYPSYEKITNTRVYQMIVRYRNILIHKKS